MFQEMTTQKSKSNIFEIEIELGPISKDVIALLMKGILMAEIKGVGKEVKQIEGIAKIPYEFIEIDPKAMFAMAKVMAEGLENHARGGWRKVPLEKHINNALSHIYAFLAGDGQDEHLAHALCRIMFAVAIDEEQKEKNSEKEAVK